MSLLSLFLQMVKDWVARLMVPIILATLSLQVSGQIFPVQTSTQLVPPYSVYLSDYATPGNEKLRVILLQRDLSQPAYQVRLVMSVELNGRVIMRTSRTFNPSPINLTPGIPTVISGADLFPYLDSRNLDFVGYSREQYERTKALPEGGYQITFTAYDYRRQDVQISNAGSSFYYLSKSEPPLINVPACGTKVPMRTPQQIVFSWLPRNTASPTSVADTQYELSLYEVRPQGRNPNDIVASTQPVFKATLDLPQYVYSPADPLLLENMQYVWRVRAIDRNGKDAFRNNGYSEICTFTYTSEGTVFDIGTVKNLKAEGQTPTRGRIWWDLGEYDSYQVGYRKTGNATYEWFPARVTTKELKEAQKTQGEVKLFDLEPDTEYEARVQAQKSGYLGAYSEIVKFRTWPVQPSNCGADEDDPSIPEADDDHPLLDGIRGMIIQLDDLEMQLMEVVHLGQGWYKGTGRTRVQFLGNLNFAVKFDRLYIDENRVAGDGRVDFVTRGTAELVEQQMQNAAIKANEQKRQENRNNWTGTVFHNRIFEYKNIVIDSIAVSSSGVVEITDDQGQVTINTEVTAILVASPEQAIIIEDRNGDQYVVQKDKASGQTSVTKVDGGGLAIDEAGNIIDKKTLRKLDKMILAALKKYEKAIEDYDASLKQSPTKGKAVAPVYLHGTWSSFGRSCPAV
jgi:TANFOR domain-containing protein